MIGFLRGTILGTQKLGVNRIILCLDVQGVGYDLLITTRLLNALPPVAEPVALFTHLQVRDDQLLLYGFGSAPERDLFRQLISVSGVGPQLGLALLDSLGLSELVQAIVSGNTRRLSRTPGVGTKTAERLALELKTKLAAWRDQTGLVTTPAAGPIVAIQEDVEMTLLALGYTAQEIRQALEAVGQSTALAKNADAEAWLRETITWLSQ
ncbi:Holliday junction branch migration protein RuvA [Thermosynechococcaceae cyanobacterium BACA0444]|uniref:Holliday junction branch migration complex subunit RuvA n=1 Tax=Pseudocalidococcus azoricus BACA0444 TaxID=2918990 RepID=A0AAE4FRB3_9CYAN|nr:Holliday junction branch migration protein RuvA [Pseudocalidococcus azoricus]MDS3860868.1 Holliday junction branch migration protein RuvA [Pseudocalidococcus azoricus BACA0444]